MPSAYPSRAPSHAAAFIAVDLVLTHPVVQGRSTDCQFGGGGGDRSPDPHERDSAQAELQRRRSWHEISASQLALVFTPKQVTKPIDDRSTSTRNEPVAARARADDRLPDRIDATRIVGLTATAVSPHLILRVAANTKDGSCQPIRAVAVTSHPFEPGIAG